MGARGFFFFFTRHLNNTCYNNNKTHTFAYYLAVLIRLGIYTLFPLRLWHLINIMIILTCAVMTQNSQTFFLFSSWLISFLCFSILCCFFAIITKRINRYRKDFEKKWANYRIIKKKNVIAIESWTS